MALSGQELGWSSVNFIHSFPDLHFVITNNAHSLPTHINVPSSSNFPVTRKSLGIVKGIVLSIYVEK